MNIIFENRYIRYIYISLLRSAVFALLFVGYTSKSFALADPTYLDTSTITIIYASFGEHNTSGTGRKFTVTSQLTAAYKQNPSNFTITANGYIALFGDPAPNIIKSLIVFFQYQNDPNIYVQSTNVNNVFQFSTRYPTYSFNPSNSPTNNNISILKAWYGDLNQPPFVQNAKPWGSPIGSGVVEITATLQFNLQSGGNSSGPDPAPNIVKGLLAIFMQNGLMYFQIISDGQPLSNFSAANAIPIAFYNGMVAGKTQGTTDGNNPEAIFSDTTGSSSDPDYKSGYKLGYDTSYWQARGTNDGTAAGVGSTATTPPTTTPSLYGAVYAAAYNAAAAAVFAARTNFTTPVNANGIYANWNSSLVLPTQGVGSINFQAVAINDITVLISPTSNNGSTTTNRGPAYEIVLGGWGNKASCVRKNPQAQGPGAIILAGGDPSSPVGNTNWNTARIITNNAGSPALITINVDQYKRTTDQQNIVKITVTGAVDANNNPVTLTYEDTNPILTTLYFSLTSWDTQIVYSNITATTLSTTAIDTDRGTTDGTYDTIAGVAPANGVITTGSATYNQYYLAGYNSVYQDANNAITAAINDAKANNTAATSAPSTASNPITYMTAYTKAYNDYKSGNTAGNSYGSTDANANPPVTTVHDTLP